MMPVIKDLCLRFARAVGTKKTLKRTARRFRGNAHTPEHELVVHDYPVTADRRGLVR